MRHLLGARVKERVTGVTGVVTTIAEHLTGCARAWVEQPVNEKGDTPGGWWDVSRLDVIELGAVKVDAVLVESAPSPSDVGDPYQR